MRRHDRRGDAPDPAQDHTACHRGARRQGKIASQPLADGPVGTVAHRDADAMEAQTLEIQELGLTAATLRRGRYKTGAHRAPVSFQPSFPVSPISVEAMMSMVVMAPMVVAPVAIVTDPPRAIIPTASDFDSFWDSQIRETLTRCLLLI